MEPRIIYEDEEIVALDKPSGMIVHPDLRHEYSALTEWLEKRGTPYHLVHRIDRETSGLLLVAKNESAHATLKEQFQERQVRKVYRAFLYGALKEERGTIERPIGSARGGLGPRSATKPYGAMREALTTYRTIRNGKDTSYVEVFPKTGRTHQIRVHFSSIQHPVICDPLYAPGRPALLGFERLALHALSLSFTHPNGEPMTLEAPLPPDFLAAEKSL